MHTDSEDVKERRMMIMTEGNGSTALFRESRAVMVVLSVIERAEWTPVGEIAGSADRPS